MKYSMDSKELTLSIGDCFDKELGDYVGEMPEFTLDMFLNDGIFKDFPVFSGISTVYRVGKGFSEFAHYKKLIAFINAINAGIVDEQKRSDYAYKIKTNEQFRTREMEYIQVLIDRYIGLEKPQMLAKLYLAYLDEKILWIEFTTYAEVVDRFLPMDYKMLLNEKVTTIRNIGSEPLLRLMALGLVAERYYNNPFVEHANGGFGIPADSMSKMSQHEKVYQRTEFGDKLVDILGEM